MAESERNKMIEKIYLQKGEKIKKDQRSIIAEKEKGILTLAYLISNTFIVLFDILIYIYFKCYFLGGERGGGKLIS